MFEGKHIHFSPVDNKPLCSYSSKLCRQRRLNGYAFCIRHILEDKSAPFKRCTYVTRNNNQICQNAIPKSQERGYCHSHMQVAGIIPKTERKVKNPPPAKPPVESNGTSFKSDSNSNSSNSNSNSNSSGGVVSAVKKDPNAVFKFEEEHSEIQWIPKGGRINGIVNGGKVSLTGKDLQVFLSKETNGGGVVGSSTNGRIPNGKPSHGKNLNALGKKAESIKNGKLNQTEIVPNGLGEKDSQQHISSPKSQAYGKKLATTEKPNVMIGNTVSTTTVKHHRKLSSPGCEANEREGAAPPRFNGAHAATPCAPEYGKYFDQLITLKSVEKSVSHSKTDFSPAIASTTTKPQNASSCSKLTNSPRTIATIFPTHSKSMPKGVRNCNSKTSDESCSSSNSSAYVDLFNSICAQKVTNSLLPFSSPDIIIKSKNPLESRQEFLARVRQAFKSQYLIIKNTANDSDKNEKIWKRALRNSLVTCIVKDSSYCAHVIVQNDPKKYSDLNENEVVVSIGKHSPFVKPKKSNTAGLSSNDKGKQGKKNGLLAINGDGKSMSIKSGINLNKDDNLIIDGESFDPSSPGSFPMGESKAKSKAPKRNPIDADGKLSQSKKKAKKTTDINLSSNLMDGSGSESSSQSPLAHTHLIRSISGKKSGSDSLSAAMDPVPQAMTANKKRKFDLLSNGSEHHNLSALGSTSTFRIPKAEDSSHLSDIDIKMENGHGQIVYNNYNGHISNHHPLLHPHSGSATTAKASNLSNAQVQLQHLLSQPDLRTLATTGNSKNQRNQGINTVLNSVGSTDMGTSDGVITDASFDSTFDHSVSTQQDCDFSDDDLENSLEFQIDPETEHQASRLLEDNELTEDDLNELFPETSNKLGRSDLSDLGVDFSSAFDANDIDYSLFANIFPFSRSSQSESISISNQY